MATATRKKKIKQSKCKTFPIILAKGKKMPSFDQWMGHHVPTDSNEWYDNIEAYEDEFVEQTFYTKDSCDKVIFNLEEWCDPFAFYPENKADEKPFQKIDRKSYTVSVRCDTWDQDCCYNDYVGHGTFKLMADGGFYDDLEKIGNGYVKKCIVAAFYRFLESICQEVDGNSDNETWIGDWLM